MSKCFFIAPTSLNSGLTSVSLGLVRALDTLGINTGFFKPFSLASENADLSSHFAKQICKVDSPEPMPLKTAQQYLSRGDQELLMEKVIENFQTISEQHDIIIVEGLVPDSDEPYITRLNIDVASNLDAEVILVVAPRDMQAAELNNHLELAAGVFASPEDPDVLGVILNKTGGPDASSEQSLAVSLLNSESEAPSHQDQDFGQQCAIFSPAFKLIGSVPWNAELCAPRIVDIANQLALNVIHEGSMQQRHVKHILVAAAAIPTIVRKLTPGTLVVTSGDRLDVILASCMAAISGVELAGLLLTGDHQPDPAMMTLCQQALSTGLPFLTSRFDTYRTAFALSKLNKEVQADDLSRMEAVMNDIAAHVDLGWLDQQCQVKRVRRLSPPAFRHRLSERARAANKTIVLPEGNEPRTVCAAVICHERGLANCVLIGNAAEIHSVATLQGVTIPDSITIIDPEEVRERYVAPMVALRKNKGLTPQMALALLEDSVVLATMMVALDEVDGLVSGAVHTTANTVRPALQLIKTNRLAKIVSSVFFMCLPEQVVVYGDCAINPDPNAEQLADIAIQSADSAKAFGIEPKVAMISYSTGSSGSGDDVEKVREATRLAQQKRPDLVIDGPLQYDAASTQSVAKKKAPNSPVAGQATVFIFPDLNTGNTTYKAVQRSANVISIGPMLQGLRKPVNDLSRGALIEDIVFTIALTAVQAKQVSDANVS